MAVYCGLKECSSVRSPGHEEVPVSDGTGQFRFLLVR